MDVGPSFELEVPFLVASPRVNGSNQIEPHAGSQQVEVSYPLGVVPLTATPLGMGSLDGSNRVVPLDIEDDFGPPCFVALQPLSHGGVGQLLVAVVD